MESAEEEHIDIDFFDGILHVDALLHEFSVEVSSVRDFHARIPTLDEEFQFLSSPFLVLLPISRRQEVFERLCCFVEGLQLSESSFSFLKHSVRTAGGNVWLALRDIITQVHVISYGMKQPLRHFLRGVSRFFCEGSEVLLDASVNRRGRSNHIPVFRRSMSISRGLKLKVWECFDDCATGFTIASTSEDGPLGGYITKIKVYASYIHNHKIKVSVKSYERTHSALLTTLEVEI